MISLFGLGLLVPSDQLDGHRDMVAVGLDDVPQALRLGVVAGILFEMKQDARPSERCVFALLDSEAAETVAFPAPAVLLASPPREDFDPVRHHEGRIEADAELADQVHLRFLVAELAEKLGGARMGDGAQVLDQFVAVHPDAAVADLQPPVRRIRPQLDAEVRVSAQQLGLRQRQVAQAVARVGAIGDQLTQKDVAVRVERVGDNVQQTADFGLEGASRRLGIGFAGGLVGSGYGV